MAEPCINLVNDTQCLGPTLVHLPLALAQLAKLVSLWARPKQIYFSGIIKLDNNQCSESCFVWCRDTLCSL